MNARRPLWRLAGILFAAALCLGASSCISEGYRVDLKPAEAQEAAAKLKSPPRYRIAALRFISPDQRAPKSGDFSGKVDVFSGGARKDRNTPQDMEQLRRLLSGECRSRFPGLFAPDGETGVPVAVCIDCVMGEENVKLGAFLSGFCTLGTIPGPYSMQFIYKVNVLPCDGAIPQGASLPDTRDCVFEQAGWVSVLSPLGLIPFWGKTDEPPRSFTLSDMERGIAQIRSRSLALMADAVAIELSKRQALLAGVPESSATTALPAPALQPSGGLPAQGSGPSQAPGGGIVAPVAKPSPANDINSL